MYNTSVTIVIISPNIKKSKWINWEIEYCLSNYSRKGRTSHTNGVVGVIMKVNGGYNWLDGSYIEYVEEEETFLKNPQLYIDNAYTKSENFADGYVLRKER